MQGGSQSRCRERGADFRGTGVDLEDSDIKRSGDTLNSVEERSMMENEALQDCSTNCQLDTNLGSPGKGNLS